MRLQTVLAAVLVAACGGSVSQSPPVWDVSQLHCILRADASGRWFVQHDEDHVPMGVLPHVEQSQTFVRVLFDRRYTHAGVVHVSSDDDFAKAGIAAGSNLGLTSATITVTARGQVIDPAAINSYAPQGSGNLWVSVTMLTKR